MQTGKLVRVYVDGDLCVGSTMCVSVSPTAFQIQSDGHAAYIAEGIDEAVALDAAELCPVSAIKLVYEE
jgi:ferredoxin